MSAPAVGPLSSRAPVVHDETSQARRRFEVWHLRHGSHDFVFAATGQALQLRRPRLRLALERSIAPV